MNNLVNHQSQHLIRIILVALAIILLNVNISAQSDSLKTLTETIINNLLDEPSDEKDNDELFELIDDLVSNPIDLNEASLSDLQRIPGMSIWNASLIVEHRKKYGSFFSVDELRLIDALTDDFVDKVKPFITINPNLTTNSTNVKNDPINIFNSLRSNLQLTMRSRVISDLQERRGFKEHEYEGSIQKIYNRFLVKYGSNISAGFVTEKDPGEKSINEFTSFHFALKNFGLIHSLVLGDYTLEFGQGLALWSPYAISKSSDAIYAVQRKAKIINPYKSTNENNFFRGVGAVIVYDNFLISGFYSNNYFDANIDSLSNGILSTPIDGYHRTKNEIEKRKSAKEKLLGIRLDFIEPNNSLEAGFLYYNSKFSNSFIPNDIHDFRRDQFNCYSFYSNFYFDRMKVFGEAAYDGTSVASVLGTNIQISDNFSFITHIRNYPRNYRNIHAFAFGEKSGATKNEFGIYSGFQWSTSIGEINFYYDQFKFPYATFENPLPSAGDELLFNLRSKPIKKLESNLRVRYEKKEITRGVGIIESLVNSHKYSIRGEMTYEHSRSLRIKTRVEAVKVIVKEINADENGILIAQDVKLSPIKNLTFDARILFFQTDSFNSAIYTFENDLTGLLSSSALYGKGIRWYLLIKYGIANFLTLSAKYSETYKPLEKSLGTGLAEINTNIDNKIGIQLEISL